MNDPEILDPFAYRDGFAKYRDVKSTLIFDGGMKEKPLISIVIPTFRRPDLLKEAIASALMQKSNNLYEVVVVDNESAPDFAIQINEVINSLNAPNLKLYRNEKNVGMFGNWNRCIELAEGEWITILNDDDLLLPDFIVAFESIIKSKRNPNLIQFGYFLLDKRISGADPLAEINASQKNEDAFANKINPSLYFWGNNRAGSLGIVFKKELAFKIGGFDENDYPASDLYFLVKYIMQFSNCYESEFVCCAYRVHENESGNPEVLAGFVAMENKLRNAMSRRSNFPILTYIYSVAILKSHINNLEIFWKVKIPLNSVCKKIRGSKYGLRVPTLGSRILGKLIKLVLIKRLNFTDDSLT